MEISVLCSAVMNLIKFNKAKFMMNATFILNSRFLWNTRGKINNSHKMAINTINLKLIIVCLSRSWHFIALIQLKSLQKPKLFNWLPRACIPCSADCFIMPIKMFFAKTHAQKNKPVTVNLELELCSGWYHYHVTVFIWSIYISTQTLL